MLKGLLLDGRGLTGRHDTDSCVAQLGDDPNLVAVFHDQPGLQERLVEQFASAGADALIQRCMVLTPLDDEARTVGITGAEPVGETGTVETVVFESEASRKVFELADRVAQTDVSVMITGESGTGKEVIARRIHSSSIRRDKPFLAVNCAAIPENMLEAMLFGHEKGAYTGAQSSRAGKFELADGGTLLLDEITEMPLALQAKLLRVLQEKEVERLGADVPKAVDVRVLATSNRDITRVVADGLMREDLYFRLCVFPLRMPALRERPGDILPLANHFLSSYAARFGRNRTLLSDGAMRCLLSHSWPGNVRELENVMQRALVLTSDEAVAERDLLLSAQSPDGCKTADDGGDLAQSRQAAEASLIRSTLRECNGVRRETAQRLGISERTLRYKLKALRDSGVDLIRENS